MATNKRKDAAALFELLDKSTIRVPKNGADLKIPSWWSSQSNPAGIPSASPEKIEASSTATATTAPPAPPASRPMQAQSRLAGFADDEAPPAAPPAQTRLYQPPPAREAPASSPSIRPPGVSIPAIKAFEARAASRVEPAKQKESSESIGAPQSRVFAPNTYAAARASWPAPRPGAFARLPAWMLWTGAAAVAVIVCGVVVAARHGNKASASNAVVGDKPLAITGGLLPAATFGQPAPALGGGNPIQPVSLNTTSGIGHVYDAGQVSRTPELYYVVIASTPSQKIAAANAKFLADHGIDVSAEVQVVSEKPMYRLVSVQGFSSAVAAKPFRDRIVEIGHLTDDYKKSHRAWDDAMVRNGLRSTASASAMR